MTPLKLTLLSALMLSACSASSTQNILPNTLNLAPLESGEIIDNCKVDHILDTTEKEIICVPLPFPDTLKTTSDKEVFAVDISRQYADAIIAKGWTAVTEWPLVYSFEKPVDGDCSTSLQIMTWLVDETKSVEDRNFETSRITFIEKQNPICGDKRKVK